MAESPPARMGGNHFQTLRNLAPYLWPRNETGLRVRVVLALAFLVCAKVANVYVPMAYARAVDALTPHATAAGGMAACLLYTSPSPRDRG